MIIYPFLFSFSFFPLLLKLQRRVVQYYAKEECHESIHVSNGNLPANNISRFSLVLENSPQEAIEFTN